MSKKISELPKFIGTIPSTGDIPVSILGTTYRADKTQISNTLDLSYMPNPSEGQIVDNNGGTGVILPLADAINAGLMSPSDFVKAQTFPTLQQILDNNHDLVNGNNFQGTDAGVGNIGLNVNANGQGSANSNTGNDVNANGESSATNNTGSNVNANGQQSAQGNTGSNVNANGNGSGRSNIFNNINLFGLGSQADADNQTVFAKDGLNQARISFADITGDKKAELPNKNGTFAFLDDVTSTNLSYTPSTRIVANDNGTGFTIPLADGTNPGLLSSADFTKLQGVHNEEYKTADFTAENGGFYVTGDSGAVTVTDPTSVVGEGYTVHNPHYAIIIGGVTYSPGAYVLRRFITGGWISSDLANISQIVAINQSLATKFDSLRGDFSATATAQTSFTITFGGTQPNNTYFVGVTARNALTAAQNYVMTKTTTSFTVTYLTGLTGTVNFDWVLHQ